MFGFFKKKEKKQEQPPVTPTPSNRDIFQELFPLSAKNKVRIEKAIDNTQIQMHGEEGWKEIRTYRRNYEVV